MKEIDTAQAEVRNLNATIKKIEQEIQTLNKLTIVSKNCQEETSKKYIETTHPKNLKQRNKICIV